MLKGTPYIVTSFHDYWNRIRLRAWKLVKTCFKELVSMYDVIIVEGAGSVAEPNFINKDIANLRIAYEFQIPAILVADIERGGAFASILGTLKILPPKYRRLIKGIIINKFEGDFKVLKPAIDWIERKTGIKVVGVIPKVHGVRLWPEDSLNLEPFGSGPIDVAVIAYPTISNFNDLEPLRLENDVSVRFIRSPKEFGNPDLLILPGCRNTVEALHWMKVNEIDKIIKKKVGEFIILGICGGHQILGNKLSDPYGLESGYSTHYNGLGVTDVDVVFEKQKVIALSKALPYIESLNNVIFEVINMKDFISLFPNFGETGRLIKLNIQLSMISAIIAYLVQNHSYFLSCLCFSVYLPISASIPSGSRWVYYLLLY